jgi:hypothetical protein
MSVWFDDGGRYFGIATLGFGNLAGGAQWRFASFGGGVLRRDARFVDDGVRMERDQERVDASNVACVRSRGGRGESAIGVIPFERM